MKRILIVCLVYFGIIVGAIFALFIAIILGLVKLPFNIITRIKKC
jgi:hypothetical protein